MATYQEILQQQRSPITADQTQIQKAMQTATGASSTVDPNLTQEAYTGGLLNAQKNNLRYNTDGTVNTGAASTTSSTSPTSSSSSSSGLSGFSVSKTLTPDEYKAKMGLNLDENGIREQVRKENQARIDAINGAYDRMLAERRTINEGNMGSTRAINARSGLMGSDFGNTNLSNQADANAKALQAIEDEKTTKINMALSEIDNLAQHRIDTQRAQLSGDADKYNQYLEKEQAKAKDLIKNLGASGVSLDTIKQQAPDQLKTLLESSGMSETELTLALNAARPTASQTQWKTDVKGNHLIMYGIDPTTGKMVYQTQELPADAAGNEIKVVGDEIWSISPDGKTATKLGGPGAKPKSLEGFTLSPGEVRFGSDGKVIARGPDKNVNARTSIVDAGGRKLLINSDTGETIQDLGASTSGNSDKPTTADERKAATFAKRTTEADQQLNDLETKFTDASTGNVVGGFLPNFLQSSERQQFEQSKRNFINALLRRESGAAISNSEFDSADKQYFAQPGDTPETLAQKRQNRQTAIEGLKNEAGRAYGELVGNSGMPDSSSPDPQVQELLNSGYTQDQINQLLGKTEDLGTSQNSPTSLGDLSAKYESSGNPGAIGYDNTGGFSYGKYQLAHDNAKKFIEQSPYANEFQGLPFNSQAFRDKWKEIAQKDPQGFDQAQHDYIEKTHFEPQVNKLAKLGIDIGNLSPVVQNVIWSTAVQHGPTTGIIANAIMSLGKNFSESDLIKKIYNLRWNGGRSFANSTPDVKKAVYNRFFGKSGEMKTALDNLKSIA